MSEQMTEEIKNNEEYTTDLKVRVYTGTSCPGVAGTRPPKLRPRH